MESVNRILRYFTSEIGSTFCVPLFSRKTCLDIDTFGFYRIYIQEWAIWVFQSKYLWHAVQLKKISSTGRKPGEGTLDFA